MHFSFAQMTDHRLRETETTLTAGYSTTHALRATLRHLAEHVAASIDFVVSTGDLVEAPTEQSYQNLCQMLDLRASSPAPGPQLATCEGCITCSPLAVVGSISFFLRRMRLFGRS